MRSFWVLPLKMRYPEREVAALNKPVRFLVASDADLSVIQEVEKLLVCQSSLPNDASHDMFRQVEALVRGNCHPARFFMVLHLDMGSAHLVDIKPCPLKGADDFLRLEVGEFLGQCAKGLLDCDFDLFRNGHLLVKRILGNLLTILYESLDMTENRV